MLNKKLSFVLASCLMLGSFSAAAADEARYTINLSATIPTDAFHVTPVESGWVDKTQEMAYDFGTQKLLSISKQFQYKNTSGAIQASLTNTASDGSAVLSNGTDTIPLNVSFNGVKLSNTPADVVTADAAKAGGRTNLVISQGDDSALSVTGSFTGQVAMIFEPNLAVTPSGNDI